MEVTRDGGRRVENFADPTDKLAQSPSFGGKPFITAMIRVMKIHSGTPIILFLIQKDTVTPWRLAWGSQDTVKKN